MRTLFWAAVVLAVGACGTKDQTVTTPPDMTGVGGAGGEGGSGGGGDGGGGGSDMEDAGVGVEDASDKPACGVMSCMPGEYCCDGTCGACAPIGTNCPADPCPGGGGG